MKNQRNSKGRFLSDLSYARYLQKNIKRRLKEKKKVENE